MGILETPVVGITSFCDCEKNKKYDKVRCSYINAVYRAGGLPVIIPPFDNNEHLEKYIDLIDVLVLSGGDDINPSFYGEDKLPDLSNIDENRDRWEIAFFKKAYELDMPILGICRGMQVINVSLGGTLYQDIDYQLNCDSPHLPVNLIKKKNLEYVNHRINILEDTKLEKILCSKELLVNSHHHQAIKDIGSGLKVAAYSECGIIESIENEDKKFLLGVQWHPEDLIDDFSCFNNLFKALISAAR